jgi:CheY-like chemotaxis protein
MRAARILCVDDEKSDPALREALQAPCGYEVLQAGDGRTALEMLTHQKADLELLDAMMPGLDGYQVCKDVMAASRFDEVFARLSGDSPSGSPEATRT